MGKINMHTKQIFMFFLTYNFIYIERLVSFIWK